MPIPEPFPDLDELLEMIGDAGQRLADMRASEGAAGNISVCVGWPMEVRRRFPMVEPLELPYTVPDLAGKLVIVTGSGRRLRDIHRDPAANLGVVAIDEGGKTGRLYTASSRRFARVTSEFNSHLAVHQDQIRQSSSNFHAVVHAQPLHITYLSHIRDYQAFGYLNQHLLRWQPEIIINLPQGIGVVPFLIPGSSDLMSATLEQLRHHRVIIWSKHGVVARSDVSVLRAADRIEYVEIAAHYEYLNLTNSSRAEALSAEEIRRIASTFGIEQNLF